MVKNALFLVFALSLVTGAHGLKPESAKKDAIFQAPPQKIVNFTLGYDDMLASLLWVRAVQDLHVCDQKRNVEGERSEYSLDFEDPLDRVLNQQLPTARCEFGWVFEMVDLITDLDPQFRAAFQIGGTFLSVAVDDREGANAIFTKGTQYFPGDWRILFSAAYNELFEMKRPKKAAELMHRAAQKGAPPWIYSLAAGLYSKVGQAQFAKTILESVLERNPRGPLAHRIELRLEKINRVLKDSGRPSEGP